LQVSGSNDELVTSDLIF